MCSSDLGKEIDSPLEPPGGLCSFWRLQGRIYFLAFPASRGAHIPPSSSQQRTESSHSAIFLVPSLVSLFHLQRLLVFALLFPNFASMYITNRQCTVINFGLSSQLYFKVLQVIRITVFIFTHIVTTSGILYYFV